MFEKLEIFRLAQGLATHAAKRQTVIAQNVANADTPGYRARDLVPFAEAYARGGLKSFETSGPLGSGAAGFKIVEAARPGQLSPNGNNVSIETEMLEAAQVKGNHDLALTVYQTSLDILRTSLGRR